MESAHGAPIATSGRHEAAGRVIGINPCRCDPRRHDERSVSVQARKGKPFLSARPRSSTAQACVPGVRRAAQRARHPAAWHNSPGQLVGQCAGRLVVVGAVLDPDRPVAQSGEGPAGTLGHMRGTQHRARSMCQQHAQVAITALREFAQHAGAAGGEFAGRASEPAGEVPGAPEVIDTAAGGGHEGGGGEQADTGNGEQRGARRTLKAGKSTLLCSHCQHEMKPGVLHPFAQIETMRVLALRA